MTPLHWMSVLLTSLLALASLLVVQVSGAACAARGMAEDGESVLMLVSTDRQSRPEINSSDFSDAYDFWFL